MSIVRIGIIGYSDIPEELIESAELIMADAFDVVSKTMDDPSEVEIVSGLSDVGIPGIAYREADKHGFKTVGLSAREVKQYDWYDVDEVRLEGEKFGDESEAFVDYITHLFRFGGRDQSRDEMNLFLAEKNPDKFWFIWNPKGEE